MLPNISMWSMCVESNLVKQVQCHTKKIKRDEKMLEAQKFIHLLNQKKKNYIIAWRQDHNK